MAVKVLKLINGEDIIGDYEEKDGKFYISSPARLLQMPTEDGGMNMGIMPWIPFSKDTEVVIKPENLIIDPMEAADDIRSEYNKRFGSGLDIPVKDLIL